MPSELTDQDRAEISLQFCNIRNAADRINSIRSRPPTQAEINAFIQNGGLRSNATCVPPIVARTMTASEAIAYCVTSPTTEADGDRITVSVTDRHGERHWIAWELREYARAKPRCCSECPYPFAEALEPYSPV